MRLRFSLERAEHAERSQGKRPAEPGRALSLWKWGGVVRFFLRGLCLLARIAVLDPRRKMRGIASRRKGYLRPAILRRHIVGEFAVETLQMRQNRFGDLLTFACVRLQSRHQLHDHGEEAVAVRILLYLKHEFTGHPLLNPRLLQADGHILRVDVRAKIGDREVGASEDIDERQRTVAA